MVIVNLGGGLANQMNQYAVGRYLAIKLNTELKIDTSWCSPIRRGHSQYRLSAFNILEVFATPQETNHVIKTGTRPKSKKDLDSIQSGDAYIQGHWLHDPRLYKDIADIIKREFTLKKPFNPVSETWRQKILSAECSVSMHFRHGDFVYNSIRRSNNFVWNAILPLDYYQTCIDILKQRYSNPTVFVFSDNLPWVKENLHLDVPTEFVEGCETDDEEFILMSLCKHNVTCSSTFSVNTAWLNSNPDKKVFLPLKSTAQGVQQFLASLTPEKKDSFLNSLNPELKGNWMWIPFDFDNQPEITQRPFFSLLLVVNDDALTLSATLDNLLSQNYKFYEVIIIDNASTDGSDKICQQAIEGNAKVTYKRLAEKVNNATAWNEAIKVAQGKYISFIKSGDRFLTNSLADLYVANESHQVDIIHIFAYLAENEDGDVVFANNKFSSQRDVKFKEEKRSWILRNDGRDAAQLLLNHEINSFLGTKLYNVEFLTEQGIKFDETLDDEAAEISFQKEAFLKTNYLMYIPNALYVAPVVNNVIVGGGISVQDSDS